VNIPPGSHREQPAFSPIGVIDAKEQDLADKRRERGTTRTRVDVKVQATNKNHLRS
jgi:hypothetical protein